MVVGRRAEHWKSNTRRPNCSPKTYSKYQMRNQSCIFQFKMMQNIFNIYLVAQLPLLRKHALPRLSLKRGSSDSGSTKARTVAGGGMPTGPWQNCALAQPLFLSQAQKVDFPFWLSLLDQRQPPPFLSLSSSPLFRGFRIGILFA